MCDMQPRKADYRALALLAIFIGGVLIAAAVLSPPVFFAARAFIQNHSDSAVSALLADSEFPGYFNRVAMLAAFTGFVPLLRSLRLTWREMTGGLGAGRGLRQTGLGFFVALAWIIVMGLFCIAAHAAKLKPAPAWAAVAMPLASGYTVATLEEMLFRGGVLGILSHSLGARRGLWWATGLFALVHFLKPPVQGFIPADEVTWTSGFVVIPQLFRGFGQWNHFIGEFLLLFAVGWVLGRARQLSGGLWLGVGLHAGWVAGMKYFGQIVVVTQVLNDGSFAPWMVRNTCKSIVSPIVGIVPVIAVMLTGITALLVVCQRRRIAEEKAVAGETNPPQE